MAEITSEAQLRELLGEPVAAALAKERERYYGEQYAAGLYQTA